MFTEMREIEFTPIWFDSLGAKSMCTLVKTSDISVVIDPGVAVMQPSFPASWEQKIRWMYEARSAIKAACEEADLIVVSHYHHDHYMGFSEGIYDGKLVLAKDPNRYINDSQRLRAERLYEEFTERFLSRRLEEFEQDREAESFPDPIEFLPKARSLSYGDYTERKMELLEKGRKWFRRRIERWNSWKLIPELRSENCRVLFSDGREYRFKDTELRFSRPFFHGIEYARVGWVIATTIVKGGEKLIHTSDLEGPVIEDQAEWIIKENPDVLILDGPSTYLIPYMLNLINLKRAVKNLCRVIEEAENLKLVIYDHHLLRDRRFKDRVREVYEKSSEVGVEVTTAAEYLGEEPVILRI
ncbi:MBL fold metallo-hydrolase [Candidatus Bathyarchaeota archaeon]|nr:MAG: MBL fold metallo-hydrolase [Candidatus Bathyarchaeota archaeon]